MTNQFITWLNAQHFDKPMVEAVGKIFHACFEATNFDAQVEETYNHLIHLVHFCVTEDWYKTISSMKHNHAFTFELYGMQHLVTVYIDPVYSEPQHADDAYAIEVLLNSQTQRKSQLLLDVYIATMQNSLDDSMKQNVDDELKRLLTTDNDIISYIKTRLKTILYKENSIDTTNLIDDTKDGESTFNEVMLRIEGFLEDDYPGYETEPFKKFVYSSISGDNIDEKISLFAKILNYYGLNVPEETFKNAAHTALDKNMTVLQAIYYISGKHPVGKYLESNNCVQLIDGRLWRNGLVYNKDKVVSALKKMYDAYRYEETVETMSDEEYKKQSLMHRLRGNHTQLPKERVVKNARPGNELSFKEWATTVDDTGKTPLDAVLDSLADDVDTVSSNQDNDERMSRIAQSSLYPAVESVN